MKDSNWIKQGTFSHRGLHNAQVPENSIAAFNASIKHGFDIELDVRYTKDKQLIVFHDQNLNRMCGKNINIKDANYADIKDFTLKNSEETIPLLRDVLNGIPTSTKLLIELKQSYNNKEMVQNFLRLMKDYKHIYAIHSFQPSIVFETRKQAPHIIRGFIAKNNPSKSKILNVFLRNFPWNFLLKPDFFNYKITDLPNKKMDKYKKKGITIISYTARSQEDLDSIKNRYDNAVFEHFLPKKKQ
jgi:glycerophosphoryl diester phosphodiesterase